MAVLTAINSVAVIALIRQVGLLHLRVNPLRALESDEGMKVGDVMSFDEADWSFRMLPPAIERVVFAFISPTCGLCAPLLPGIRRLAGDLPETERLCLVGDTTSERFEEYLSTKRLAGIATIADEGALERNQIPGAPFVAVVDRDGAVLACGGVNTLEQIELLVEDARARADRETFATNSGAPLGSQLEVISTSRGR